MGWGRGGAGQARKSKDVADPESPSSQLFSLPPFRLLHTLPLLPQGWVSLGKSLS